MVWKDVIGYEGYYEVSDTGLVKSTRSGRLLKGGLHEGYRRVALCVNRKQKSKRANWFTDCLLRLL